MCKVVVNPIVSTMAAVVTLVFAFLMFPISSPVRALSSNYYDHTCPQLESIVTNAVKKAMLNDKTVPSALLRMHFHDCFIRVQILNLYLLTNSKVCSDITYFMFVLILRAAMLLCCWTQKEITRQRKMDLLTFHCMHFMSLTMQRRH